MNESMIFAAEDDAAPSEESGPRWHVLIVDDDEEVHHATLIALRHSVIQGRKLAFHHCYSEADVKEKLPSMKDIAVIFLDVMMESEVSGLNLVSFIRKDCGLTGTRIVLRTGQPGYAPEASIMERYDIDDYRAKTDLTHLRMLTTTTAAIKSYHQIKTITEAKEGLELIVRSVPMLLKNKEIKPFSEGVLKQLRGLLGINIHGVMCAQRSADKEGWIVIAGAGGWSAFENHSLESLNNASVGVLLEEAIRTRKGVFHREFASVFLPNAQRDAVLLVHADEKLTEETLHLLQLFGESIAACYEVLPQKAE